MVHKNGKVGDLPLEQPEPEPRRCSNCDAQILDDPPLYSFGTTEPDIEYFCCRECKQEWIGEEFYRAIALLRVAINSIGNMERKRSAEHYIDDVEALFSSLWDMVARWGRREVR